MNSSYDQYQGGVFQAERIFSVTLCVQNEEEEASNQWRMRLVRQAMQKHEESWKPHRKTRTNSFRHKGIITHFLSQRKTRLALPCSVTFGHLHHQLNQTYPNMQLDIYVLARQTTCFTFPEENCLIAGPDQHFRKWSTSEWETYYMFLFNSLHQTHKGQKSRDAVLLTPVSQHPGHCW